MAWYSVFIGKSVSADLKSMQRDYGRHPFEYLIRRSKSGPYGKGRYVLDSRSYSGPKLGVELSGNWTVTTGIEFVVDLSSLCLSSVTEWAEVTALHESGLGTYPVSQLWLKKDEREATSFLRSITEQER